MKKKYYLLLCVILLFLSGCCSRLMWEETRLYYVDEYTIHHDGSITAKTTVEDKSIHIIKFKPKNVYFHSGKDTIVVESGKKGGSIDDCVLGRYLYLNERDYNSHSEKVGAE